MKNEVILRLGLFDFEDIDHDEITRLLGLQPSKVYVKGDKRNEKNPDSPLIKRNGWLLDAPTEKYSTFEKQMDSFLELIEAKIDIFRPLLQKYYCEFSCAIFIYYDNGESTPWVHLNSKYNKLIRELNIEFDIDLYVFPYETADGLNK